MTNLFLSYSRQDVAFVRKLYDKLAKQGFSVWVDWEGIPPSAEWLAEIYHAIEQADTFIFVVSVSSCQSEICQLELQHAVKLNKRLIPVVLEEPPANEVPVALSRLHWLFFRESDDFADSTQALLKAINTDLGWVRAHTRLLNKSLEWDAKSQEKSLLLRGKELGEIEAIIAGNQGKEPLLTDLQSQFVTTSRGESSKRSRMLVSTLAAVALIIGGASWFGFQQSMQKEAEQKAGVIKEARVIAGDALQKSGDQGILRAVEAARLLETVTTTVDPLIHNTLIEKGGRHRFAPRAKPNKPRKRVSSFGLGVRQLTFTADNKLVASSWREEVFRRWSLCLDQADKVLCANKQQKDLMLSIPERKVAAGIHQASTRAALANGKLLKVYQLADKVTEQCSKPLAVDNISHELILSPDGKWAALFYGSHWDKLRIIKIECGDSEGQRDSIEIQAKNSGEKITAMVFHPDGQRIFIGESNGALYSYKLKDGSTQAIESPSAVSRSIQSLAITENGHWLAIRNQSALRLIDLQNNAFTQREDCCKGEGEIRTLQFNHAGTQLAVYQRRNNQREILIWDISQSSQMTKPLRLKIPYKQHDEPNVWVRTIAFSSDDSWIAAGLDGDNHDIVLWPLSTSGLIQLACSRVRGKNKCD